MEQIEPYHTGRTYLNKAAADYLKRVMKYHGHGYLN